MAALEELTAAYAAAQADPAFQAELRPPSGGIRRPADGAVFCGAADAPRGRRQDLLQARGPAPHGRAQDQQRDRPGAARPPHGQAADHRRDRGRPARRRHRGGLRQVRPGMRRLHGGGRHGAAGAQRVPDAADGRRGAQRRGGAADAEGGDQRGHARLGDQRPDDPLHPGHGLRGAPLSDDGARFSPRDRRGRRGADPRARGAAARRADRLRGRRQQRDGPVLRLPRATRRADDGRRGGRARASVRGGHAARFAGGRLGVLQGCKTSSSRTGTARSSPPIRSRRDWTTPPSGPSTPTTATAAGSSFTYATDDEVLAAFQLCSRLEGIIPALESSHALVHAMKRAASARRDKVIVVNLSGRGDKDVQQVEKFLATRMKSMTGYGRASAALAPARSRCRSAPSIGETLDLSGPCRATGRGSSRRSRSASAQFAVARQGARGRRADAARQGRTSSAWNEAARGRRPGQARGARGRAPGSPFAPTAELLWQVANSQRAPRRGPLEAGRPACWRPWMRPCAISR